MLKFESIWWGWKKQVWANEKLTSLVSVSKWHLYPKKIIVLKRKKSKASKKLTILELGRPLSISYTRDTSIILFVSIISLPHKKIAGSESHVGPAAAVRSSGFLFQSTFPIQIPRNSPHPEIQKENFVTFQMTAGFPSLSFPPANRFLSFPGVGWWVGDRPLTSPITWLTAARTGTVHRLPEMQGGAGIWSDGQWARRWKNVPFAALCVNPSFSLTNFHKPEINTLFAPPIIPHVGLHLILIMYRPSSH